MDNNIQLVEDYFDNPTVSIKKAQSTFLADVNEIMLGFYVSDGWDNFKNASEAQAALEVRKKQISPEEYKDQDGRAKVMAQGTIKWANEHGFSGKVTEVWWTARPGILSKAVGYPVDSRKNPTDVLLKFSDGSYLGVSAKSTGGSGDIGFKNPGIGSLGRSLGVDFGSHVKNLILHAIEKFNLPSKLKKRKEYIRDNPQIQQETKKIGIQILTILRDELFKIFKSTLDDANIIKHIKTMWIDAEESLPPYIKVTGHGKNGNYTASIIDPINNPKLLALGAEKIIMQPIGTNTVLMSAGKVPIMKMRWKFESEPLASAIKLSGDPAGGKDLHEEIIEQQDIIPIILDLKALQKKKLDESFLRAFGSTIETIIGRMFGLNKTPIRIKGTKTDIEAFTKVLNSEKKYIEAWKYYGLDDPRVLSNKSTLENAIKVFEKATGIIYPFK